VADVLVEFLVLVFADVALGPGPQRRRLVDGLVVGEFFLFPVLPLLLLHQDGLDDVVGVFADDRAQLDPVQQVFLARAQVKGDRRAPQGFLQHLDGEFAASVRLPADSLIGLLAGAPRVHGHLVRDDERGIEPDPELPDQVRVLLLVAREPREKLLGAGLGDRAEVLNRLLAVHSDAVVADAQRLGRRIVVDMDLELEVVLEQLFVVQRLEPQLVAGVGGVGDQLAQKDLAVRVQRMNHQLQ